MHRALICDDDETFRDFVSRVLALSGWQVTTAEDGDAAMNHLENTPAFELVMVDLLMPLRSGWEVIDFLRRAPEYTDTRIVAVTGLSPAPDERQRLVERNVELLTKDGDFTVDRLLRIINKE